MEINESMNGKQLHSALSRITQTSFDIPACVPYMEKVLPVIFCGFFFIWSARQVMVDLYIPLWIEVLVSILYVLFLLVPFMLISNKLNVFFVNVRNVSFNSIMYYLQSLIHRDKKQKNPASKSPASIKKTLYEDFLPFIGYLYKQRITLLFLIILVILDGFDWGFTNPDALLFFSVLSWMIISRCFLALSLYSNESVNLSMNCMRLFLLIAKFLTETSIEFSLIGSDPIMSAVVASFAFDAIFLGVSKVYTKQKTDIKENIRYVQEDDEHGAARSYNVDINDQ